MIDRTKIMPCPFCGATHEDKENGNINNTDYNLQVYTHEYEDIYYVYCYDCDCKGPAGNSAEIAIENWNKRNNELLTKLK